VNTLGVVPGRAAPFFVMPALVAGIHVFLDEPKTWMAGTGPAMTAKGYIQAFT
jgi:hypothetical protein